MLAVVLVGVARAADPTFVPAPGSPFAVGTNPHSIAVADLNRDRRADLAVANEGSDNVSILLGNRAGGFSTAIPVAVGDAPLSVAAADLNRDRKPDLAVANSGSDSVSILLGDGAGGFTAAAPVAAGDGAWFIAVADLNRDRKPDLAVANVFSDNVSILLGDGAGGFSAAAPVPVGDVPYGVAIADLNRDRRPDLAVANQFSHNVSILLGDGAGGFSAAAGSPVAVGSGPSWVAAADLNRDRKLDLAVTNQGSDDLSILLGDGAGGFTVVGGSPPLARSTVDRPDDSSAPQVHVMYVLPSDGQDRALDLDGTLASSVAAFQGWLDTQTGGRALRLDTHQGELDVTFFVLSQTDDEVAANGAFVRDAIEAELDAAGFNEPDKLYAVYYEGTSTFACGGGAWPPTLPGNVAAMYLNGLPESPAPCASNPFAGPGEPPTYMEFAMLHEILHTLGFVATCAPNHHRAGHVSDVADDLMWAGDGPWVPSGWANVVLDAGNDDYFDHDGACLDLADSLFLQTVTNDGDGDGAAVAAGDGPTPVAAADLNGDRKLDLAVGNIHSDDVSILLGDGAGGFSAATHSPLAVGDGPFSLAVARLNRDRKPDLAVANYGSNDVTVLLNTTRADEDKDDDEGEEDEDEDEEEDEE